MSNMLFMLISGLIVGAHFGLMLGCVKYETVGMGFAQRATIFADRYIRSVIWQVPLIIAVYLKLLSSYQT